MRRREPAGDVTVRARSTSWITRRTPYVNRRHVIGTNTAHCDFVTCGVPYRAGVGVVSRLRGGEAAVRKVQVWVVVAAALCALVATSAPGWATPGPPSAPRSVSLVPGKGAVTLRWVAPFSDGGHKVVAYEVLSYHDDVKLAINVFHSPKVTERITGLKNGSVYTFKVAAHNHNGWSYDSVSSKIVVVAN
jgi:hypothetical protein